MVYMHFPSSLTEEEDMLQKKYAKLRKKVGSLLAWSLLGVYLDRAETPSLTHFAWDSRIWAYCNCLTPWDTLISRLLGPGMGWEDQENIAIFQVLVDPQKSFTYQNLQNFTRKPVKLFSSQTIFTFQNTLVNDFFFVKWKKKKKKIQKTEVKTPHFKNTPALLFRNTPVGVIW